MGEEEDQRERVSELVRKSLREREKETQRERK